jgi:integrase
MTMANSTAAQRPKKPRNDFPLFPHRNGRWCKKVRGKAHYFTRWVDDPKGELAAQQWADQKDDLLAGRVPRVHRGGLTIQDLCNHFLAAKEQQRDAGELSPVSFADYLAVARRLVDAFGRKRLVDVLTADDFQAYRATLSKRWGPHRLGGEVQRVRSIFKYGYDSGLIDKPVRFGPSFKRPSARVMRAHRQKQGPRMFEADELRRLIDTASVPLKAMLLLAANCGYGNSDCGTLRLSAVDLQNGWIEHPRPKTAVERRSPLWPETIEALRDAIEQRPKPRSVSHSDLVFITRCGQPWSKNVADSPITKETRKLLDELKLYRPGLSFYTIRHVFETIGGGAKDQVALNSLMGHVDSSMAAAYRERIDDDRLIVVSEHVRQWLFGSKKTK